VLHGTIEMCLVIIVYYALLIFAGIVFGVLFPLDTKAVYSYVGGLSLFLIISNGLIALNLSSGSRSAVLKPGIATALTSFLAESSIYFFVLRCFLGMDFVASLILAPALSSPSPAVILPLIASFEVRLPAYQHMLQYARVTLIASNICTVFFFVILQSLFLDLTTSRMLGLLLGLSSSFLLAASSAYLSLGHPIGPYFTSALLLIFVFPFLFAIPSLFYSPTLCCFVYLFCYFWLLRDADNTALFSIQSSLWALVKPVLFFLMGASLFHGNREFLAAGSIFSALVAIAVALAARLLVVRICLSLQKNPHIDSFFILSSSIPKATIQAGLAPFFLSSAFIDYFGNSQAQVASQFLALSIVATVGIGAFVSSSRLRYLCHPPIGPD